MAGLTEADIDMGLRDPGYGWYRKHLLDRSSPQYTPIPSSPPKAEADCGCACCKSQGYYWESPFCRMWQATCETCEGNRSYWDWTTKRTEPCGRCRDKWAEDVRDFKSALRGKIPEPSAQYERYMSQLLR